VRNGLYISVNDSLPFFEHDMGIDKSVGIRLVERDVSAGDDCLAFVSSLPLWFDPILYPPLPQPFFFFFVVYTLSL
jgi:hypothetical protein